MNFTVKDLIESQELSEARILHEGRGLLNEIKGVTIIEAPDIVKFISGGEVLLTGLYAFRSCSMAEFSEYLLSLEKKEVSAIFFKRGRQVDQAEEKIEALLRYCRKRNVVMAEVPFSLSFQKIMSFIMQRLFNEEVTSLKYYKTTHDNFCALGAKEEEENDLLDHIVDMLEKLIRNPCSLYDENLICIASGSNEKKDFKIEESRTVFDPGLISSRKYYIQKSSGGKKEIVTHMDTFFGSRIFIVIEERDSEFGYMDCIAVENAVDALSHEFSKRHAIASLKKQYQNDIVHKILLGKADMSEGFIKETQLIGLMGDCPYRVISAEIKGMEKEVGDLERRQKLMDMISVKLQSGFKNSIIHRDLNIITLIEPQKNDVSNTEYRKNAVSVLKAIDKELKKWEPNLSLKAGAGKETESFLDISRSYRQAEEALFYSEIGGYLNGNGDEICLFFDDLGIFKLLCQIESVEELKDYVPTPIKKLFNLKKPQRDDLIETLRTYFNRHNNLAKTAQDLFIHYKTASYRLDKIQSITGLDFDNPGEVLSCRIGLVVLKIIESKMNKMQGNRKTLSDIF